MGCFHRCCHHGFYGFYPYSHFGFHGLFELLLLGLLLGALLWVWKKALKA